MGRDKEVPATVSVVEVLLSLQMTARFQNAEKLSVRGNACYVAYDIFEEAFTPESGKWPMHQAGAYLGFCGMKRHGVFVLLLERDASPL